MSAFTSFSGKTRTQTCDTARDASFSEIPIISLKTPHDQLIAELKDACTRVGFFYIKNHDIPQPVIDNIFQLSERFFALDREEKDKIHYKKSKILRGYEPPAEVLTDETKKADLNEAFNWGYNEELELDSSSNPENQSTKL